MSLDAILAKLDQRGDDNNNNNNNNNNNPQRPVQRRGESLPRKSCRWATQGKVKGTDTDRYWSPIAFWTGDRSLSMTSLCRIKTRVRECPLISFWERRRPGCYHCFVTPFGYCQPSYWPLYFIHHKGQIFSKIIRSGEVCTKVRVRQSGAKLAGTGRAYLPFLRTADIDHFRS